MLGNHAPLTLTGPGELLVCESGTNPSRLVDCTLELGLGNLPTRDAGDRRQAILELTAKGRELEGAVRGVEGAMYAGLDGTGTAAELATVIAVLERGRRGASVGGCDCSAVAREAAHLQWRFGPSRRFLPEFPAHLAELWSAASP